MPDAVDDEVRRRLAARLRSAGVAEREVALEVIWWMPKEFVRAYEKLYLECFELSDSVGERAAGGGARKAGAGLDEKAVARDKRKSLSRDVDGRRRGDQGLHTRVSYGTSGSGNKGAGNRGEDPGGNRWIRDENKLELKAEVDKKLRGLIGRVEKLMERSQGSTPGEFVKYENGREACRECGKLMSSNWVRCPYPHL